VTTRDKRPDGEQVNPREDALDETMLERDGQALAAEAAQARQTASRQKALARRLAADKGRLKREGAAARSSAADAFAQRRANGADRGRPAFILQEDPDLAQGLSDEQRYVATDQLRARVITVPGPRWYPAAFDPDHVYGLLVLDGLVGRRLVLRRAVAIELLGTGDIVRPWDESSLCEVVPGELEWQVLAPARLAVLDAQITRVLARWPELNIAFSARLLRRVRAATYLTAVSHLPRVEERLLAMFWHVASRWGRVTPRGVSVPLRLTHQVLGELVGAQRPSVTLALRRLQAQGRLRRAPDGTYLLTGAPPSGDDDAPSADET
jgi:CRP/FNR family cyclic AMP-dependent transcriptional regulator